MVAAELDTSELLGGISTRLQAAAKTMLTSAADAKFDDLPDITFTLLTAMAGATKAVFERGAQPPMIKYYASNWLICVKGICRLRQMGSSGTSVL